MRAKFKLWAFFMSVRDFQGIKPRIAASAYIDPTAVVIGDVEIGQESSLWPYVVVRGDVNRIRIGKHTNIQDGSIVHVNSKSIIAPAGSVATIGDNVTVGHRVLLHGCTIEDLCLIGMGSIIMDNVVIETRVVLGAGSLVAPGKRLRSGFLYTGSPARQIRPLTDEDLGGIEFSYQHYSELKQRHRGTA